LRAISLPDESIGTTWQRLSLFYDKNKLDADATTGPTLAHGFAFTAKTFDNRQTDDIAEAPFGIPQMDSTGSERLAKWDSVRESQNVARTIVIEESRG
jgi:hypothetical protein